jgi:hypothetical protein
MFRVKAKQFECLNRTALWSIRAQTSVDFSFLRPCPLQVLPGQKATAVTTHQNTFQHSTLTDLSSLAMKRISLLLLLLVLVLASARDDYDQQHRQRAQAAGNLLSTARLEALAIAQQMANNVHSEVIRYDSAHMRYDAKKENLVRQIQNTIQTQKSKSDNLQNCTFSCKLTFLVSPKWN